jgi:hypothetical protein
MLTRAQYSFSKLHCSLHAYDVRLLLTLRARNAQPKSRIRAWMARVFLACLVGKGRAASHARTSPVLFSRSSNFLVFIFPRQALVSLAACPNGSSAQTCTFHRVDASCSETSNSSWQPGEYMVIRVCGLLFVEVEKARWSVTEVQMLN